MFRIFILRTRTCDCKQVWYVSECCGSTLIQSSSEHHHLCSCSFLCVLILFLLVFILCLTLWYPVVSSNSLWNFWPLLWTADSTVIGLSIFYIFWGNGSCQEQYTDLAELFAHENNLYGDFLWYWWEIFTKVPKYVYSSQTVCISDISVNASPSP